MANTAVSRECEDFIATYEKSIDQVCGASFRPAQHSTHKALADGLVHFLPSVQIVASGHLPRCQDRVEAVTAARSGLLYRWQKPQIKPSRPYTPPSPSPTPPPQPQPSQVPADTLEDGKQPSPPSAAPSERDSERVVPRIPSIPSAGITSFASMSTLSCLSEYGTTTHKAACPEPGGYPTAREAIRDKTAGSVADKSPHPQPQAHPQPQPQTPSPPSALPSAVRATLSTPRMATGCAAARHSHTKSLTDLRLPVVERHHSLSSSAPCTCLLGSADDTPPPLQFATPQKGVHAASDAGNRGRGSTATQRAGG